MQEELLEWWDAYRKQSIDLLVSFAMEARSGDYTTQHECQTTFRSREEKYHTRLSMESYFAQEDWFDSFVDSPDMCAIFCSTTITTVAVDDSRACFSGTCAPAPIDDFTCVLKE